jgi:hypothetical protein
VYAIVLRTGTLINDDALGMSYKFKTRGNRSHLLFYSTSNTSIRQYNIKDIFLFLNKKLLMFFNFSALEEWMQAALLYNKSLEKSNVFILC